MGIKDRLRPSHVDERRLREHEARAGEFVSAIEQQFLRTPQDAFWERREPDEPWSIHRTWKPVTDSDPWRRLLDQPPEVLVSAAVVASARAREFGDVQSKLLSDLARRRLPYEPGDIELMVEFARQRKHGPAGFELDWQIITALKPVVAAAEAFAAQRDVSEIETALRRALDAVESNRDAPAADKTKLRARLRSLLAEAGSAQAAGSAFIVREDDWGRRVIRRAQALDGSEPILTHFAQATSSRPTKRWQESCAELIRANDGLELVRVMLEEAVAAERRVLRVFEYEGRTYTETIVLSDPNVVLLRGAVWAVAVAKPEWGTELVGQVLERWPADKVGNACLYALGEIGGDAVGRLMRVKAEVKDRGILKQADRAITAAAAREGLTPGQLAERLVPTRGLDPDGTRTIRIDHAEAILMLVAPGRIEMRWRTPDGKETKTVPAAVREAHAPEVRALSSERSELRKTVTAERKRLEDQLSEERTWPFAEWRRLYRDHPVTGRVAATLLWTVDGESVLGADADASDGATVTPWHPIQVEADEVARWRNLLLEREIVQPFKQAHREIYLLAPAERATETYSNRFAGHVLRYPQAYALLKERGWSGNALGPWDGGYEADVQRDFPAAGLAVTFYLEMVEADDFQGPLAELCTTDQVRFIPLGERNPRPTRLEDVSPAVFSEAMRDVDLFVSVSSIAADPTWADRGEDRFNEYWQRAAFGELGTSAMQRRELLGELIPRLSIAERCELEDRYLRVRGDLRTYRIHLGSGNILMEPNDQFLCIVPARGMEARSRRVFLPFEGDSRLNVILSKAFLLARDTRIKDATILHQIKHGRPS